MNIKHVEGLLAVGSYATLTGAGRVTINVVPQVTKDNTKFMPGFEPIGTIDHGHVYMSSASGSSPALWERFTKPSAVVNVPHWLTSMVRAYHPGCLWQLAGGQLYAVKGNEVVAVIGDEAAGGW